MNANEMLIDILECLTALQSSDNQSLRAPVIQSLRSLADRLANGDELPQVDCRSHGRNDCYLVSVH